MLLKGEKKMENVKDNINPDHYKNQTSLECIESMELIFGYQKTYDFCLLNAWKYIWRWKNKNGKEDLNKAQWYCERASQYVDLLGENPKRLERIYNYVMNHNKPPKKRVPEKEDNFSFDENDDLFDIKG